MQTLTEKYIKKYGAEIDQFCLDLMGIEKESTIVSAHAFMLLDKRLEKVTSMRGEHENILSFLYLKARTACIKRLQYLNNQNINNAQKTN